MRRGDRLLKFEKRKCGLEGSEGREANTWHGGTCGVGLKRSHVHVKLSDRESVRSAMQSTFMIPYHTCMMW